MIKAIEALSEYQQIETRTFFISNIDYQAIESIQRVINPETTLFIISSKSFNTIETRTNAETLRTWMQQTGCDDLSKHFIAVSNNLDAAKEFGINDENVFELWDWVGGPQLDYPLHYQSVLITSKPYLLAPMKWMNIFLKHL